METPQDRGIWEVKWPETEDIKIGKTIEVSGSYGPDSDMVLKIEAKAGAITELIGYWNGRCDKDGKFFASFDIKPIPEWITAKIQFTELHLTAVSRGHFIMTPRKWTP